MTPEPPRGESFSHYFAVGVAFRIGLSIAVMSLAYLGAAIGDGLAGEWATFAGALGGLAAGAFAARAVLRRWDPLDRQPST